jgi:flagellar protein FliL
MPRVSFANGALALALALALASPSQGADRSDPRRKEPLPGMPVFIDMQPIVLPVIEGSNVMGQVGVLVTVELVQGRTAEEVEEKQRELTDAFITELYRIYGWRSGADRVIAETLVKRHLQATADRILGKGVVQAILIRQLVEHDR